MNKVTRFPISGIRRFKNQLGRNVAPCHVSMRWLRFPAESRVVGADDFMTVDVMAGEGREARKLCQPDRHPQRLARGA